MIYKKVVEHNGLTFSSYNTVKDFDGVLTDKGKRLVLSGAVSFTFVKGSYKYPEQFMLKVFSTNPLKHEVAVNGNYNTVEIAVPKEVLFQVIRQALNDGEIKL